MLPFSRYHPATFSGYARRTCGLAENQSRNKLTSQGRYIWRSETGAATLDSIEVATATVAIIDRARSIRIKTLVWARGDGFPIDQLEARLKCPHRGSRRAKVIFSVPGNPEVQRAAE